MGWGIFREGKGPVCGVERLVRIPALGVDLEHICTLKRPPTSIPNAKGRTVTMAQSLSRGPLTATNKANPVPPPTTSPTQAHGKCTTSGGRERAESRSRSWASARFPPRSHHGPRRLRLSAGSNLGSCLLFFPALSYPLSITPTYSVMTFGAYA